jgi:uncharacterized alpha-E superfamily protein
MLSRVAESLYWMSRYVERAECLARIVDVNLQLLLDIPPKQSAQLARNWWPVMASLGEDEEAFFKRHKKADVAHATDYLVFDRQNPSSVSSCLSAARENARTVREQINEEMWEQINRTYLWITSRGARGDFQTNQYEFFQRVLKTLQLFQGITDSVMLRGEGWEFIQIGKHLERADKTTRLLDDKFHLLRAGSAAPGELLMQWLSVLRCSNSRQIYQQLYESVVQPRKVAELLLLNDSFPRSVKFCVARADRSLRRISGVGPGRFSNGAEKLSGRLLAELNFSAVDDFEAAGLHQAMDDLQIQLNDIGQAVHQTYFHLELPPDASAPEPAEQPQ